MRRAWFLACWGFVGASIALACGGSSNTDLFGSSGDIASSSSGASGTTSSGGSSGAAGSTSGGSSGTTASSSGTTSSSGTSGTTTSSSGTSGTTDAGTPDAAKDAGPTGCRRDVASDCDPGEYCKVTNCAAAGGTCTKKPNIPVQGDVVCGCDGVSYWNAEIAASFGVSVNPAYPAQCQGNAVKTCSAANDCPNGRFCSYATTANPMGICAIVTQGSCWGLPAQCPNLDGTRKQCGDTTCKTFCEVVKAEKPWFDETPAKCN